MAREKIRFLVDDRGRKKSVLLPVKEYEELLEDLSGLALIAERNDQPAEPLQEVKNRLKVKWQSTGSK